jgi:hypothetical protein
MLSQPHFLTCQRFRRSEGTGRDYLALWTLQSPEALKTPQYTAQWGFADWAPYITDWSRDLFDGGDRPESAFAVPPQGALEVISFDGMGDDDARQNPARNAAMMWLPVIGLDRHTPAIGLAVRHEAAGAPALPAADGAQITVYRPIRGVAVRA